MNWIFSLQNILNAFLYRNLAKNPQLFTLFKEENKWALLYFFIFKGIFSKWEFYRNKWLAYILSVWRLWCSSVVCRSPSPADMTPCMWPHQNHTPPLLLRLRMYQPDKHIQNLTALSLHILRQIYSQELCKSSPLEQRWWWWWKMYKFCNVDFI